MIRIALTLAAVTALVSQAAATTFPNDSAEERTIGSTFVGLVETDSGHMQVTHIITDAGTNPNGSTWFAYAGPIAPHAEMRGGNDN